MNNNLLFKVVWGLFVIPFLVIFIVLVALFGIIYELSYGVAFIIDKLTKQKHDMCYNVNAIQIWVLYRGPRALFGKDLYDWAESKCTKEGETPISKKYEMLWGNK